MGECFFLGGCPLEGGIFFKEGVEGGSMGGKVGYVVTYEVG